MGPRKPPRYPPPLTGPAARDIRSLEDPHASAALRGCLQRLFARLWVPVEQREDLEQDVLEVAVKLRSRYDPARCALQTWLEALATFVVLDFRKHHRRKLARFVPEEQGRHVDLVAPGLNPEQSLHAVRSLDALEAAMPGLVREVFILYAEGCTHDEILARTGLSKSALAYRLQKLGEVRDETVAGTGEKPRDGPSVRFCALPLALLAARYERWSRPRPSLRAAPRRVLAMMAAAALTAVVAPLGWAARQDQRAPSPTALLDAAPDHGPLRAPAPSRADTSLRDIPSAGMPSPGQPPSAPPTGSMAHGPVPAAPASTPVSNHPPAPRGPAPPSAGEPPRQPAPHAPPSDRLLRLAGQATLSGARREALSSLDEHARRYGAAGAADRTQLARAARSQPRPHP